MAGTFGAWDLYTGVPQAIYVCDRADSSVVTLNVVNRNSVKAEIRVAVSTSPTAPLAAEMIEYDLELAPKGVLERTGIVVSSGMYLVVISDTPFVNAVCWGVDVGESIVVTPVTRNNGTAPTWVTPAGSLGTITAGAANLQDSVSLVASDPNTNVKYSVTAGALPAGSTINESGAIINVASTTGYTSGLTGETASFTVTASNGTVGTARAFSIIKKWYDGSTSTLAATAADIKRYTGTTTNGNYWINFPTVGPVLTYCDMSTDGGAWMRLAYAGSVSGVGNSNQIMFDQFGSVNTDRAYNGTSFSRFDLARLCGGTSASRVMWRRSSDANVILIHSMDEMWNRIPGGSAAGNRNMVGSGAGYPINIMKMSVSGPSGLVSKSNGRYESGPGYPGIAWNSTYDLNSDNVGSFDTYLSRRSIIYWETNGPESNGQWFHADPLQLGPARGPTFAQQKKDIEAFFKA